MTDLSGSMSIPKNPNHSYVWCGQSKDGRWKHVTIFNYQGRVGITRSYTLDTQDGSITGSESGKERKPARPVDWKDPKALQEFMDTLKDLIKTDPEKENLRDYSIRPLFPDQTIGRAHFERLWARHHNPEGKVELTDGAVDLGGG